MENAPHAGDRQHVPIDQAAPDAAQLPWLTHNPGDLASDSLNVICPDADVVIRANLEEGIARLIAAEHNEVLNRRADLAGPSAQPVQDSGNPWRLVLNLRARLWSIAHAAGIETKEDLMQSALEALPEPLRLGRSTLAGQPITMTYRNYRGEVSDRTVTPKLIWWGSTDWHPEPGWLMTAYDHEKQADRDFALSDADFRRVAPSAPAEVEGLVERARTEFARIDLRKEGK